MGGEQDDKKAASETVAAPPNDGTNAAGARREPRRGARWAAEGFSGAGDVTGSWIHERNPNRGAETEPRGTGRVQRLVRQPGSGITLLRHHDPQLPSHLS